MSNFDFSNESLKKAITLVKTVKPTSGDISFSFNSHGLVLFSHDNRRSMRVNLPSSSQVDEDFSSDEFYIFADKTAAFSSDLSEVSIRVNEESLSVVTKGDGQSRKFSLKKRSVKSKRPPVPTIPNIDFVEFTKKDLDESLRAVSCSASIKDAKTEDDMRVMQVHFYDNGHAVSFTRFHGSLVKFDQININTSIVSSDIPSIRSFCAKIDGDVIKFGQDNNKIYLLDPDTGSFLTVAKVDTKRPPLQIIPSDEFELEVHIDKEALLQNLRWASLIIERTQRVTLSFARDGDSGTLSMEFAKQEASGLPVTFVKGDSFSLDVPINILTHIVAFLEDTVVFKFRHQNNSYRSMIEVSSLVDDRVIKDCHYLTCMRSHD